MKAQPYNNALGVGYHWKGTGTTHKITIMDFIPIK